MRRKPNVMFEILKVVLGGILAIPIGALIVYSATGKDPLGAVDYLKGFVKGSKAIMEAKK